MDSLDLLSPYLYRYKRRNFPVSEDLLPKDIDALQHFELRPTDIFIITYPKSGTTWMRQILLQVMDAAHPERTEDADNQTRCPWLELKNPDRGRSDPRLFGTHLPFEMLPQDMTAKRVKVVYVWRNPKDVLVSFYHHHQSATFLETPRSFEEFFQQFLEGDVFMGSWFDHVQEYYDAQDQLEIHFVQYENMLTDCRGEVVKLCAFLGKDLTDEAIDHVVEMSTFKNMKTDPKANYRMFFESHIYTKEFMRKGEAGDWKNFFTVAQNERFDNVFQEKISNFPLTFTWEI